MMFGLVKPMLSKKTKEKIHVTNDLKSLKDYISPENLMREYGGTDPYVHEFPSRYWGIVN